MRGSRLPTCKSRSSSARFGTCSQRLELGGSSLSTPQPARPAMSTGDKRPAIPRYSSRLRSIALGPIAPVSSRPTSSSLRGPLTGRLTVEDGVAHGPGHPAVRIRGQADGRWAPSAPGTCRTMSGCRKRWSPTGVRQRRVRARGAAEGAVGWFPPQASARERTRSVRMHPHGSTFEGGRRAHPPRHQETPGKSAVSTGARESRRLSSATVTRTTSRAAAALDPRQRWHTRTRPHAARPRQCARYASPRRPAAASWG